MRRGHVFIVQGRIGNLDCDAIVVPTDRDFVVEPAWHRALGLSADDVAALEPDDWPERRVGRGKSGPAPFVADRSPQAARGAHTG